MREQFFFLLSGVYETLPRAELEAVLQLLDPDHKIVKVSSRILVAETSEAVARLIIRRTAYTKLAGRFFSSSTTKEDEILDSVEEVELKDLIDGRVSSIAIRGIRLGGVKIRRMELERAMGERVLRRFPRLKVNLKNPDLTLIFVSERDLTVIGSLLESKPKHLFDERTAGRRPFSLPSTMQPDFSRAMVNLARARIGGKVLDPFAGACGIIIEAVLLGYDAYGVELKEWIARGGWRNLRRYVPGLEFMIVGDARKPMFRFQTFDAIITDPPYGRSTTIPDKSIVKLLEDFLNVSNEILKEDGRIVLAAPFGLNLNDLFREAGFKLRETHLARVHKSLTRMVVVLER